MNVLTKVEQMIEAQKIVTACVLELRGFFKEKFEAERRFKNGDIVSVYANKKYMADGIVTGGRLSVAMSDWELMQYAKHPYRLEKDLKNFRYHVKGIKKDGTISSRNAVNSSTCGETEDDYGYWIKLKSEK